MLNMISHEKMPFKTTMKCHYTPISIYNILIIIVVTIKIGKTKSW